MLMMTVIMVPPLLVCFMLVMPVVPVAIFLAVADKLLSIRSMPTVLVIFCPVLFMMKIGLRFGTDNLVRMEKIETAVCGWQFSGKYPVVILEVDEAVTGDIIIAPDVGDVIVIYMIVTGRSPGGLVLDIDLDTDLRFCIAEKKQADKMIVAIKNCFMILFVYSCG